MVCELAHGLEPNPAYRAPRHDYASTALSHAWSFVYESLKPMFDKLHSVGPTDPHSSASKEAGAPEIDAMLQAHRSRYRLHAKLP